MYKWVIFVCGVLTASIICGTVANGWHHSFLWFVIIIPAIGMWVGGVTGIIMAMIDGDEQ